MSIASSPVRYHSLVKRWISAALAATGWLIASTAAAHPVPFSYLDVHLDSGAVNVTLVAHVVDVANDLEISPSDDLLKSSVVNERTEAMHALLTPRFVIAAEGRPLTPTWVGQPEILTERQSLRFSIRYPLAAAPG